MGPVSDTVGYQRQTREAASRGGTSFGSVTRGFFCPVAGLNAAFEVFCSETLRFDGQAKNKGWVLAGNG